MISLFFSFIFPSLAESEVNADPHLWLEEVESEQSLEWVKSHNAKSTQDLSQLPEFTKLKEDLLTIYNSNERIPYVSKHGDSYYNYWRDENNPRGLWRKTSLESYQTDNPSWETVID